MHYQAYWIVDVLVAQIAVAAYRADHRPVCGESPKIVVFSRLSEFLVAAVAWSREMGYTVGQSGNVLYCGERAMTRIILESAVGGNDLSDRFVNALNLLQKSGVKLLSGTKLVSKYGVIVVEDPTKVVEHLLAGSIAAYLER